MIPEGFWGSALVRGLLQGAALLAFMFAVVYVLERSFGGNVKRYRSRPFATDMTYAVIYVGGLYGLLISGPILAALAWLIPSEWQLGLLRDLPPLVAFILFWVLADAMQYWVHRWEHSNELLWRLHRVHHSQTCLTFATSWRNHLIEQLFINVLLYVPLMLLGMPKWYWLPVMLLQYVFEALQHSDLKWRFGPLYPVFVSPVFHAIHHHPERSRHDTNYGKILGVWDWIFGTLSRGERPDRYGVAGFPTPVGFLESLASPFHGPSRAASGRQPEEIGQLN